MCKPLKEVRVYNVLLIYTHTHTHTHNLTGSPQSERPCFNFQMGTLRFSGVKESKVPSEVRADVL